MATLRAVVWAVSNLARGVATPVLPFVAAAGGALLPALCALVGHSPLPSPAAPVGAGGAGAGGVLVAAEAAWALSFLTAKATSGACEPEAVSAALAAVAPLQCHVCRCQ